jgi:DNA-binding MarR family transcriptional regulator
MSEMSEMSKMRSLLQQVLVQCRQAAERVTPAQVDTRDVLSDSAFLILETLGSEDKVGMSPSELATRLGISKPAVTQLLARLERKGLIRRWTLSTDRRKVSVRLTRAGLELYENRREAYHELLDRLELSEESELLSRLNHDLTLLLSRLSC